MTSTLCDCGDCRTCRRAMGLDRTPEPVKLSESTLRILADLDTPKPAQARANTPKPKPRAPRVPQRLGYCKSGAHKLEGDNVRERIRRDGRYMRECRACIRDRQRRHRDATPRITEKPTPVPCVECGELIGARRDGYSGWVLAGADGKCELCVDRPKLEAYLAEYEAIPTGERTNLQMNRASRYRRHLERILKDGRPFHPGVAKHGAAHAYIKCGCRCLDCTAYKTEDNRKRREGGR